MSGRWSRAWSRFIHRFNYHHATVCYPEGDIQDWCQWCGLRTTRVNFKRVAAEMSALTPQEDSDE